MWPQGMSRVGGDSLVSGGDRRRCGTGNPGRGARPRTAPLRSTSCHFLTKKRNLDIAITTLTAVRNLVKGRGGVTLSALEGNTPRWAIMERVSCSESWNPPISSSRYFFW